VLQNATDVAVQKEISSQDICFGGDYILVQYTLSSNDVVNGR
jgi:hypothetical protein